MTNNNAPMPAELKLIKEFRGTAPPLTEPQLVAGRASLMSALLAEPTHATRRSALVRHRAPLAVAFTAVLAVFVALATLLPAAGRQGTTGSSVKLTLAAKILRGAARHYAHLANAGGVAEPGPKQWIYETWAQSGAAYMIPVGAFWSTFDGKQTAATSHGNVAVEQMPSEAAPPGSSVLYTFDVDPSPMNTYNALASLAQDSPAALLAAVHAEVVKDPPDWIAPSEAPFITMPPTAAREYEWLQRLLQNTLIAPPGAESAVFQAMSTLPGLRVEQRVTSATGAPADGITYDGGITDLMFSPSDDSYIGVRSIDTPAASSTSTATTPSSTSPNTTGTTGPPSSTSTTRQSADSPAVFTITSVKLVSGPGIK
jgi:hypothetical protein